MSRVAAILQGLCPQCGEGAIFAGRMTMHDKCPSCGLHFAREPGYFAGAMYISYAMAIPVTALTALTLSYLIPSWSFERVIAVAFLLLVPLSPPLFRYSRILWIHFDRTIDP